VCVRVCSFWTSLDSPILLVLFSPAILRVFSGFHILLSSVALSSSVPRSRLFSYRAPLRSCCGGVVWLLASFLSVSPHQRRLTFASSSWRCSICVNVTLVVSVDQPRKQNERKCSQRQKCQHKQRPSNSKRVYLFQLLSPLFKDSVLTHLQCVVHSIHCIESQNTKGVKQ